MDEGGYREEALTVLGWIMAELVAQDLEALEAPIGLLVHGAGLLVAMMHVVGAWSVGCKKHHRLALIVLVASVGVRNLAVFELMV